MKAQNTLGPERERLTLEAFDEKTGKPVTSFYANPGAPVLRALATYASVEDVAKRKGIAGGSEFGHDAHCFSDFFPTNPACLRAGNGHPVGLDPAAFEPMRP